MTEIVSRLLSGRSSKRQSEALPSQVLFLRPSPSDSAVLMVHPAGYPADAPPPLSVLSSQSSNPNVIMFRGAPHTSATIGSAQFRSMASKADITLHGQSIRLRMSDNSGHFSLEYPPMTTLKWKSNPITGMGLELSDNSGFKMAVLESSLMEEEKKLEIFVPCDEFLFHLILLSAITAKGLKKRDDEIAGEILQGVLGF